MGYSVPSDREVRPMSDAGGIPDLEYPVPLVVRHTFLDTELVPSSSFLEFFQDRTIQSCPPGTVANLSEDGDRLRNNADECEAVLDDLSLKQEVVDQSCVRSILKKAPKASDTRHVHFSRVASVASTRSTSVGSNASSSRCDALLPAVGVHAVSVWDAADVPPLGSGAQHTDDMTNTSSCDPAPPTSALGLGGTPLAWPSQTLDWGYGDMGLLFVTIGSDGVPADVDARVGIELSSAQESSPRPSRAPVLLLSEVVLDAATVSCELLSLGSANHGTGVCKPCAHFFGNGCKNGVQCQFCHHCPPGELKRRQKLRRIALYSRSREQVRHARAPYVC